MWLIFALTSSIILASRKVQEKWLVRDIWWSLGWMIRLWSAIAGIILWIIFSRDITGMTDNTVIGILAFIALVMYPLQTYGYYRGLHELPLSLFGMLAPITMVSSILFSWLFLDKLPSIFGYIGIGFVIFWLLLLIEKKNEKNKHITFVPILLSIITYISMGLGGVLDKIALTYVSPFTYTMMNQSFAALSLFIVSFFLFGGPKLEQAKKNFKTILFIGLSQGVWWLAGMYAIQWSPHVGYAVAMINTHTIITTLYGIIILREWITRRKIAVFFSMIMALIAFAFA